MGSRLTVTIPQLTRLLAVRGLKQYIVAITPHGSKVTEYEDQQSLLDAMTDLALEAEESVMDVYGFIGCSVSVSGVSKTVALDVGGEKVKLPAG